MWKIFEKIKKKVWCISGTISKFNNYYKNMLETDKKLEIKAKAEKLLNKSLSQIAKENNIKVLNWDLSGIWDTPLSWAIVKNNEWWYNLYINISESEKRRRFTFAHELWHFFLHKDILDTQNLIYDEVNEYLYRGTEYDCVPPERRKMEEEANEFAWCLLMPEEKFLELYKEFTIPQLSNIFNVSEKAISVRAYNLTGIYNG